MNNIETQKNRERPQFVSTALHLIVQWTEKITADCSFNRSYANKLQQSSILKCHNLKLSVLQVLTSITTYVSQPFNHPN